ncbi:MAG: hypothetical protein P8Y91_05870 [Desulfuromonadales bacterium]
MSRQKEITVVCYGYRLMNPAWRPAIDPVAVIGLVRQLNQEFESLGITVGCLEEPDKQLDVKGYGDLLNTIRLRSPADHISNLCLGHIIGQSSGCDLLEDLRRGVSRVAFAPEMIEPEGAHKVVCHNCGCGC